MKGKFLVHDKVRPKQQPNQCLGRFGSFSHLHNSSERLRNLWISPIGSAICGMAEKHIPNLAPEVSPTIARHIGKQDISSFAVGLRLIYYAPMSSLDIKYG